MRNNPEQIVAYLAMQAVLRRPHIKQANPDLAAHIIRTMVKSAKLGVMERIQPAINAAGDWLGGVGSSLTDYASSAQQEGGKLS